MIFEARDHASLEFVAGRPSLVVLRDDKVVGRPHKGGRAVGLIVRAAPGRSTQLKAVGSLLGCPTAPPRAEKADVDANRPPLPPGKYDLVAVAGVASGAGPRTQLVTEPLEITIR